MHILVMNSLKKLSEKNENEERKKEENYIKKGKKALKMHLGLACGL